MSKLKETLEELQAQLDGIRDRQFLLSLEVDGYFEQTREDRANQHEHFGPCEECERQYDEILALRGMLALEVKEKSLKGSIRLVRALLEDEEGENNA